jgi:uncharacterized surface protein with fasciclin (FAS1) repeats
MKRARWTIAGLVAAGLSLTSMGTASATERGSDAPAPGTKSLAEVLLSDGNRFDRNSGDFDILTEAALAVLKAKPNSPVKALTQGNVALTAFAPTDRAFRHLATDLTGKKIRSEEKVFTTLAGAVGIDNIEKVLLYHVVPGATIDARTALKSDGARLNTALAGTSFKVDVKHSRCSVAIALRDNDKNDADPNVILSAVNINKGNKQIAHGINAVLRPIDL